MQLRKTQVVFQKMMAIKRKNRTHTNNGETFTSTFSVSILYFSLYSLAMLLKGGRFQPS